MTATTAGMIAVRLAAMTIGLAVLVPRVVGPAIVLE
jgi:hypothetical protein